MADAVVTNTFANLNGAKIARVAQVLNSTDGAVYTGTTTIPADDTIPQNTEGTQFLSLAITPVSATNKLKIDVCLCGSSDTASRNIIVALFQDSTANALAVAIRPVTSVEANFMQSVQFTHIMTAGTTSATTFKVRAGVETSGTVTVNGALGARYFGGAIVSSITIAEIEV